MNIDRLRCFVSAARHLSFTKAGAECFIAQTAVSRHISAIEDELGFTLFERNNRQIKLTNVGGYLYKELSAIVERYDSVIVKGKQMTAGAEDTLKIGIGQYERYFVSSLVREFLSAFPHASITIEQHLYKDLTKHLKSGVVDIIFALPIISQYAQNQQIKIKKLFPSKALLTVSKKHPLAQIEDLSVEELKNHPLITIGEDEGPCDLVSLQGIIASQGIFPQKYLTVNSFEAGLLMTQAGMGMMFMPDFLFAQHKHTLKCIKSAVLIDSYFACVYMPENSSNILRLFASGISMSKTLEELRSNPII